MIVTWVTTVYTKSVVEYGIDKMEYSAFGKSKLFVDEGPEKRSFYIHRVTLKHLKPNQKYRKHYRYCSSLILSTFLGIRNSLDKIEDYDIFESL